MRDDEPPPPPTFFIFESRQGDYPGGVELLLAASCYGNLDKLRPDGPLGSIADFTFTFEINTAPRARIFQSRRLGLEF